MDVAQAPLVDLRLFRSNNTKSARLERASLALHFLFMAARKLREYFLEQVKSIVEQSREEPEGFASYFSDHEPKDEEILSLIAITTLLSGRFHLKERYPSPAEALAALTPDARAQICREFREQFRTFNRQHRLL